MNARAEPSTRIVRARIALRSVISSEHSIWWVLSLAAVIRIAALLDSGILYDGGGFIDVVRFTESARVMAETGRFSFAGVSSSAYQMPGWPAFLSVFSAVTDSVFAEQLLVKTSLILMSLGSIYLVYRLGRRVGGTATGLIASFALTVSMPQIYTGTLPLSENPFMLLLLLMTYQLIRLADEPSWATFGWLLAVFLLATYVRQTALGFLAPALIYLFVRRYEWRLMWRQMIVVILVLVVALSPWWVRNYRVFDRFVPFTSFGGAPFFEGTFQRFEPYGTGSFDAMDVVLETAGPSEPDRSRALVVAGRERLADRWSEDPGGVLVTYAVMKPAAAWLMPFYWDKVFRISGYWVLRIHASAMMLGLGLLIALSIRSKSRHEFLLFLCNVAIITVGAGYYLGLSRYVYPYVPFVLIACAHPVALLVKRWVTDPSESA